MDETAAGPSELTPVLSASQLRHDYGQRRAVDGVSLALTGGELVALIGPNGAGKTTLLSMLAGVLAPTSGTLRRGGKIGWVPQRPALYSRLSVTENLRFFARLEGLADVNAAVAAMIGQMALEERSGEPVSRLSGGNRQRVNVGIGLLGAPAVLLLDEPTAALDPDQRERLWEFIRRFVDAGTAVLFSTHDMGEAGTQPDRVLEMVDGEAAVKPAAALGFLGPVRWLLAKDVAVLRRSPLLVGILVIYPVALALMIGLAISSPPGKPKVAVYNGVKPGHGGVTVGGSAVDINRYTHDLFASITPIGARSPAAAIADVRSGRAEAAIIVPANIVAQVESLIKTGSGQPSVRLLLNNRDPLERQLVNGEIQVRVDQLEAGISKALLGTALEDLHIVVAGGELDFEGDDVSLLGLNQTTKIINRALPLLARAGFSGTLVPSLRQIRSFAVLAGDGLSFASPVLGQIQSPLTVRRSELSGASTPTATYAVAIAVAVSELFLALLLAAALLALERSEQVYSRLVRGPVTRGTLLVEKVLIGGLAAAAVTLIMSVVVSIFVTLSWGRFELWLLALILAGLAFGALGVALGALAREVAAASLLAIMVGLPAAFLALIPSTAVSSGVGAALDVISFVFPFRAGLEAIANALTGTSPGIGLALVHLAGLALAYGLLGRLALVRFGE